jgi:tetratricopeptide (TPR) repeat protein
VLVRADQSDRAAGELFRKYNPPDTPTTMVVAGDGTVIDWHLGYMPPSSAFVAALERSAKGIDTFKGLSERLAANPKDAEATFKLAMKYSEGGRTKEAIEKWTAGIALDPDGRTGTMLEPDGKCKVTYTEYAEYSLALAAAQRTGAKPDPAPLLAFLSKHPDSELQTHVSLRIARMLAASKDDALRWFEQIARKYPGDVTVLEAYLAYLKKTGASPERVQEIGERLLAIEQRRDPIDPFYQNIAEVRYASGDVDGAISAYGPEVVTVRKVLMAVDLLDYASYWAARKTNTESAIGAVETALRMYEEADTPDAVRLLSADAYVKLNLPDRAAAVFGAAYARKCWDDGPRLFNYAQFWTRQGLHLDEALAASRRLTVIAPENSLAWEGLSAVYERQKDYPAAIAAAEKAVAVAEEADKDRLREKVAKLKAEAGKTTR